MQSSPIPPKTLPRNVKVLGWVSLLNDVASEMIFPLPQFLLTILGGNKFWLGIIEGVVDSALALAAGPMLLTVKPHHTASK
jgi:hypothetical protein